MFQWLKNQGTQMLVAFAMSMFANSKGKVFEKIKAFVVEKYQKALGTEKEWDELLPAFINDLLAGPDEQPMFMTEVKEALVEPLDELYSYCVTETEWTGDEELVLFLYEAIGKPVPKLSLAET